VQTVKREEERTTEGILGALDLEVSGALKE
jgi:hypothetical protein